jgi:hypothetical protein
VFDVEPNGQEVIRFRNDRLVIVETPAGNPVTGLSFDVVITLAYETFSGPETRTYRFNVAELRRNPTGYDARGVRIA